MLNYSEMEKFLYDIQEVGLMVNEMKSEGRTTVPIEIYEEALQALIDRTNDCLDLEEKYNSFVQKMSKVLQVTY